ncbi:serine hydrolase [Aestuariibaculum sp. M13]|uniref:serine hydrolase domain-containing protein n=1 Tax=Aestuariibaculum sp. M13 TaxID=2967132 RepID=UPI002159E4F0|nr:serine hydrolase [Aestuariibaculum sp. M13]MCR8667142.1 serine hydrolase [Aestuariibaculum sp. M13]
MKSNLLIFLVCLIFFQYSFGQLKYGRPESVGFNSKIIQKKVDSIMHLGIKEKAFPGAQLLVAKQGQIIFHQAYGFHTYDNNKPVELDDIYDLASVTKILGPLPALMKLYEEGKIDLDKPFSFYWKSWRHVKDKKDITLRELLAHQSGLQPYISFINDIMKDGKLKKRYVRNYDNRRFSLEAYPNLYINKRFKNHVFKSIKHSKVNSNKTYLYSGLASLIYPQLIENLTGIPYQDYIQDNFYKPLGCEILGFNPSLKHFKNNFVPTEYDSIFRKQLTQGWVHDENAALFGGISGNAGLFGTAKDLVIIMQMYMQKGFYNGTQYFKENTVNEFTRIQYPENKNHRGLGFDKPLIENSKLDITKAYPAPEASQESFGHSGFTGTFVWADPKNEIVFIFLSNRVYPTRKHRNIYNLNIRPALQQVFYTSLN